MQIETSGKSTILNLKPILCQRYIYLIPKFDSQFQMSQFPNDYLFAFQHKNTFNRVFIGCSVSHLLTSSLRQCMKPEHSVIYIETPLFLLHMSNEILLRFKEYMNNEAEVKIQNSYIFLKSKTQSRLKIFREINSFNFFSKIVDLTEKC